MAARRPQSMALTAALVARVARVIDDPGPEPGFVYHTEDDYDAAVRDALAAAPPGDVWLFAYGSLIWNPACPFVEERLGLVTGWHRSFCLKLTRWRGTREQPGLMLALDRGGQCRGVAYRLPAADAAACLGKVFRREMSVKPPNNVPRWVRVRTESGDLAAIAFTINRRGRAYAGRVPFEEAAEILAKAAGHLGSGAEYLYNTVMHLEQRGIRDRNLWRLQALVAERIAAMTDGAG